MTRTDAHPPGHVLAELAEGILDDVDAAEVHAHTVDCALCQDTLGRLTEVRRLLQGAPAEIALPGHVSARIDAALAAEAAAGHGAESDATVTNVTSMNDRPIAWFRKSLPRVVAAAAAAAVVGFAGYAVLSGDEQPVPSAGENADEDRAEAEEDFADDDSAGLEAQDQPTVADAPDAMAEDGAVADGDVLVDAALAVWAERTEVRPDCGDGLAHDLEFELVGSTEVEGEVLVVLSDAGELFGWTLPDCDSGPTTGEPVVVVPEPEQ
ncbi:hypothetical protein [Phytoactinopolyspora mesophila]|uniref:Anti-sigma factor n=1 Tax=Phytoactinopolyspora mesophila TaxID=2650750 RepID=A0A7K3M3T6_9ACTN|nr:hypothetical protein [Phytoactinopolyspora mesophila]NDL57880.1 hypothetical protein [Phytoactinopolyspora mesophila]